MQKSSDRNTCCVSAEARTSGRAFERQLDMQVCCIFSRFTRSGETDNHCNCYFECVLRCERKDFRFSVARPERQILMIARRMDFKLDFRITVDVIFGESHGQNKECNSCREKGKKNELH